MFRTELKLKHSAWWWCSDAGLKKLCWCCCWVVAKALVSALLKAFGGSVCICTCIRESVSMGLYARAFQSGAEMNRRCGSRTVLTGSPGTIALTDPSDWVHMRIKTLSLPLSEFFLFPFSPLSCSPLCRSLSLSLTLPPLTRSPFYVSPLLIVPLLLPLSFSLPFSLCFSPQVSECVCSVLERGEVLGLYCWSDHGPKTSACLHCSESICHQGLHRCSRVPLPSGAELETLKCVSSILLFLKAKLWRSKCNLRGFFYTLP